MIRLCGAARSWLWVALVQTEPAPRALSASGLASEAGRVSRPFLPRRLASLINLGRVFGPGFFLGPSVRSAETPHPFHNCPEG